MAPNAVFRVDASVEVGGGHARRCLVLARALLEDGWSITFASSPATIDAVQSLRNGGIGMISLAGDVDAVATMKARVAVGCELLVVDHYGLDEHFERPCRPWAKRILSIDDLADRPHDCDVLVDQTPGRAAADYRKLVPSGCAILAGPDFALLDARFRARRAQGRRRDGTVRRILVSLGATDPTGVTQHVLAALARARLGVRVDIVLGAANPHKEAVRSAAALLTPAGTVHIDVDDMASLIDLADLAIGAGGVSALERCCLGVPGIVAVLAENQRGNAAALAQAGAAVMVEAATLRDADALAGLIRALATDPTRLASMSAAAAAIVDGMGAIRVREACYPPIASQPTRSGESK